MVRFYKKSERTISLEENYFKKLVLTKICNFLMAVLTRDELRDLNVDKIYNIQSFVLNYELWPNIDTTLSTVLNNPVKLKFNSNIRKNLGVIKDKKGIYMFFVEPDFPFSPKANYLMYIGRVIRGNTFFKRFDDYVRGIGNKNIRRNIQLLTNLWEDKTWVYFFELNISDQKISKIEANLFDSIVPPLNNQFRSKRALNSRSIYN